MIEISGVFYWKEDVPVHLAKDALAVQDTCNLGGVSKSFADTVSELHRWPTYKGTTWIRHHPVVVLYVSKISSLVTGDCGDTAAFSAAYDLCTAVAEGRTE